MANILFLLVFAVVVLIAIVFDMRCTIRRKNAEIEQLEKMLAQKRTQL